MNRSWVRFHLEEAHEELTSILSHIKLDEEYSEADFRVAMEHLYHHVNFAWNTRNASNTEVEAEDTDMSYFYSGRKFPKDIPL